MRRPGRTGDACCVSPRGQKRLTYVFAATPCCLRFHGDAFDLVVEELYDRANTNTTIVRSSCQQYELPL